MNHIYPHDTMFIELIKRLAFPFFSFLSPFNPNNNQLTSQRRSSRPPFNMKSTPSMYSSLLLALYMGMSLSVAHTLIESVRAVPAFNKPSSHIDRPIMLELHDQIDAFPSNYIEQPHITTSISSLLVLSIQNLACLATLSTLGLYTPALVGIGIMTSNVQAFMGAREGLSSTPHWKSTKLDQRRRRAHPRDIRTTGPEIKERSSYHVAEVFVKKLENIIRNGGRTELDSCAPSANSDDQLHAPNSGLCSTSLDYIIQH